MAIPAKIVIYGPEHKLLKGPSKVLDSEIPDLSGSDIFEFNHHVWVNLSKASILNSWRDIRKHEPLQIVKSPDNLSIFLYRFCLKEILIPQVEIRWYEHQEGKDEPVEFYRHTLESVHIKSIKTTLPDTKNPQFEKCGPLEEITFTYKKISWLYHEGYLLFTDEWNKSFSDNKDSFSSAETDNTHVASKSPEPLKITFTEGKLRGGKDGFAYGKPFVIRFKADKNREFFSNENKVDVRVYAVYNKNTEQKQVILEERLSPDGVYERTIGSLEKHFQSISVDDKVEYYATITSTYAEGAFRSESAFMPYEKKICIPWIIDCHMHINNGHAAPLPLQWSKSKVHLSQEAIDVAVAAKYKKFGDLQKTPTEMLGRQAVKESQDAIKSPALTFMGNVTSRRRLLTALPMDMDYAHYRGYKGIPIYETIDGKTMYWDEADQKHYTISENNFRKWVRYSDQLKVTKKCFYNGKGTLIPFYHYDPRAHLKNWREPFVNNLVQTANSLNLPKNLPAIGIKMYTALGYRPMDLNMSFPWDEYYSLIVSNKIPIICHGGRGGMPTHDLIHYYEREYPQSANVNTNFKMTWFYNEFVSPHAWELVLKKFPNIYLCLAHFGGDEFWVDTSETNQAPSKVFWDDLYDRDPNNWIAEFLYLMKTYPNFYVDLSYFILRPSMIEYFKKALIYHPDIKKKLLFGTDWWLYTTEKEYGLENSYLPYIENFCNRILSINDEEFFKKAEIQNSYELLAYFMVLNPMRFLQLKNLIPKLSKAFYQDELAPLKKIKFESEEWINTIPERIEDFYV